MREKSRFFKGTDEEWKQKMEAEEKEKQDFISKAPARARIAKLIQEERRI